VRLFVALEIPSAVRDHLASLSKELREFVPPSVGKGPRWVRAENLHVTLKFIGDVSPAKLALLPEALSRIRSARRVRLKFRGLHFFPNEKHPRVFWVGIEASANLNPLAADIDQALESLGIPREHRAFAPHLTLARFEPPGLPEKLRVMIQQNAECDFGSLETDEFRLIESKLKPSGAEYTTLQSFSFLVAEA
jgi:RNA 2',3'-cyclic 3'-phosphodiesterase